MVQTWILQHNAYDTGPYRELYIVAAVVLQAHIGWGSDNPLQEQKTYFFLYPKIFEGLLGVYYRACSFPSLTYMSLVLIDNLRKKILCVGSAGDGRPTPPPPGEGGGGGGTYYIKVSALIMLHAFDPYFSL